MQLKRTKQYCFYGLLCAYLWLYPQQAAYAFAMPPLQQSQDKRPITLNKPAVTIRQALADVAAQAKLGIAYNTDLLPDKTISLNVVNMPVDQVLERILRGTGLTAGITEDGTLTVKKTAAPGVLEGIVYDAKTKEPLIGAIVIINGKGFPTNEKGRYRAEVPAGPYEVEIRYIGFVTKKLKAVVKESATVQLNITLQSSATALREVKVEARRRVGNEIALLNERKNAAVVSDGISAQNIERTASITTTQALQRVTGVTITDDKYVAVRGLGDRSVVAELNGARLSSANPDRSAVPLDLVPAALLDNVTVYKTISPDRPADASAGLVELKTKSIPDSLIVEFTAQGGFNSNVGLGGKYNSFYNSDLGFLGQKVQTHNLSQDFKNLEKQYPGGLVQIQDMFIQSRNSPAAAAEAMRVSRIMQSFDPVLTTSHRKADPNQLYTVSLGNTYRLKHDRAIGIVASANYYQRTEDIYDAERNQYSLFQGVVTGNKSIFSPLHIPNFITPAYPRLGKYLSYRENVGKKTLNYGGLVGVTYRFNARNEIQAQFMGTRGAEAEGSSLTGSWQNTGLSFPVYNEINQLRQSYRTFDTYNLQGEHQLFNTGWSPKLSYNLSSSRSSQNDPDFRSSDVALYRTTRFQDPNGVGIGTDTYAFVTGLVHGVGGDNTNVIIADPNGRQYRKLEENNYYGKADLVQPFRIGKLEQLFKIGVNYLRRERDFTENILGLPGTSLGGGNIQVMNQVNGDLDKIVSPSYIGLQSASGYDEEGKPRVGGFLYQIRKAPNNYTGTYETKAFYAMMDAHIMPSLRLIGGVRFESTEIHAHVDTANVFIPSNLNAVTGYAQKISNSTNRPNTSYVEDYKPYYSVNLVYTYHSDMNFRMAYSTSLARPELRELTNIYEFDPFQFAVIGGNPDLKNQLTRNLDFRWEWFTGPGEVLAASVFGKIIEHPLQRVFIYHSQGNESTSPEFPLIIFQNDPNKGHVYGVELEARRDLGKLWRPLHHLFIGANLLLDVSTIDKNPERLDAARINDRSAPATSPVFEQAPYSINTYLDYDNSATGTNITASFNMVGARLIQVQLDGTPDLYDRPTPVLDLVFSQKLSRRFVVKGFAKNVLNPAFRQVYTNPGNNGKYHGETYIYRQYYKGSEFSLGLTYKLF
ncbi:TonB-dependent receptor plug domain-containing protein [Chitinophaga agrisoli]|uniref:TonB-dependent receptor plug domain-containing protein n=1 Tax=Chitinophaga agrisoli TaxID=2607653 RepID=A0A5B2VM74_9BACT|nr:TonB-dependent receptor [Chitinophaga agrisoli]KAA2239808.1 TonB-dependent receptor plug domain-containing protein [Chitinophaga agrisoli]